MRIIETGIKGVEAISTIRAKYKSADFNPLVWKKSNDVKDLVNLIKLDMSYHNSKPLDFQVMAKDSISSYTINWQEVISFTLMPKTLSLKGEKVSFKFDIDKMDKVQIEYGHKTSSNGVNPIEIITFWAQNFKVGISFKR